MTALSPEARAALMDLAEKVSAMRAVSEKNWGGSRYRDGRRDSYDIVLETIVAELDRK